MRSNVSVPHAPPVRIPRFRGKAPSAHPARIPRAPSAPRSQSLQAMAMMDRKVNAMELKP